MKTIKDKKTISKNGIEIIDFCEPTLLPDFNNPNFVLDNLVKVNSDYISRPDLLCLVFYNDVSKVDLLLKFNEISDPLDINEGDLIFVPNADKATSFYKQPDKEPEQTTNNFTDSSKKSKKDQTRLEILKKISSSTKNGSTLNTKVNELKPGEQNIEIDSSNNRIVV